MIWKKLQREKHSAKMNISEEMEDTVGSMHFEMIAHYYWIVKGIESTWQNSAGAPARMLHFEVDIAGQAEKLAEEYLLPTAAAFLADLFAAVAAAKVHLFPAHSGTCKINRVSFITIYLSPYFQFTLERSNVRSRATLYTCQIIWS